MDISLRVHDSVLQDVVLSLAEPGRSEGEGAYVAGGSSEGAAAASSSSSQPYRGAASTVGSVSGAAGGGLRSQLAAAAREEHAATGRAAREACIQLLRSTCVTVGTCHIAQQCTAGVLMQNAAGTSSPSQSPMLPSTAFFGSAGEKAPLPGSVGLTQGQDPTGQVGTGQISMQGNHPSAAHLLSSRGRPAKLQVLALQPYDPSKQSSVPARS